jgi:hypothetical protein
MAKTTYEVIHCPPGRDKLQNALNDLADRPCDVISVVPDYGSGVFGSTTGSTQGYLIVVCRAA